MNTQSFLKEKFSEFYKDNINYIKAPSSIEQREFGFFIFKENVVIRHKGFTNTDELRLFINKIIPSHLYYSAAYYEMPEEKMENKIWLGADLYFDIDSDHMDISKLPCRRIHDQWICRDCGFVGKGIAPNKCPFCEKKRFHIESWPCEICLESAKYETIKLLEILTDDFGFSSREIDISFSGHRGYHVLIENKDIHKLDSTARKEIVDYITGIGLETSLHGLIEKDGGSIISGPNLNDFGWQGRIAKSTHDFLKAATKEDLEEAGLNIKEINEILSKKETIFKSWKRNGPWKIIKGIGSVRWKAIIKQSIKKQSTSIDTLVTTDIHRLVRMPYSLHGKTGLLKISFPKSRIEEFDPLKSAIAFKKGETTIYVNKTPKFRIGEETFGPYKQKKIDLPMAAAIFLLCKGAGEIGD